jgi:hypothetical protein
MGKRSNFTGMEETTFQQASKLTHRLQIVDHNIMWLKGGAYTLRFDGSCSSGPELTIMTDKELIEKITAITVAELEKERERLLSEFEKL